MRQHRRREAELSALFDTAGDLAALRDLDAVLRSIVRRARMLLGTDTAYLTLRDAEAGCRRRQAPAALICRHALCGLAAKAAARR